MTCCYDERNDIAIHRGDSHHIALEFINDEDDKVIDYLPIDAIVKMTVKTSENAKGIEFEKEAEKRGNEWVFYLAPSDTEDMSFGKYLYDVEYRYTENGREHRKTVILGRFIVMKEVTL